MARRKAGDGDGAGGVDWVVLREKFIQKCHPGIVENIL